MSFLKPQSLLLKFSNEPVYIDNLNIPMLVKCLHRSFSASSHGDVLCKHRYDSYTKSAYKFLPKAFKYRTSEHAFDFSIFTHDSFYTFGVNVNEVHKDYCEAILKVYPNAKSVKRFYKKLKNEQPEYFI